MHLTTMMKTRSNHRARYRQVPADRLTQAGPPKKFSAAALGGAQAAADDVMARGRITDLEILDILDADSPLAVDPLESMRPARFYWGHLSMSSASSHCTLLGHSVTFTVTGCAHNETLAMPPSPMPLLMLAGFVMASLA